MKINYSFSDEDIKKYISTDLVPKTKNRSILKLVILIGGSILLIILLLALIAKEFLFAFWVSIPIIASFIIYKLPSTLKRRYIKNNPPEEPRCVEISDNELILSGPLRSSTHKLKEIKTVDYINDYFILIKFKPGDTFTIPKSAFNNEDHMIDFINRLKTSAKIL